MAVQGLGALLIQGPTSPNWRVLKPLDPEFVSPQFVLNNEKESRLAARGPQKAELPTSYTSL